MASETLSIAVPGGSLRVRVASGGEPPVFLVHGGPGGLDYLFKFFAGPLKRHGWRAVGLTQRGSDGSPSNGPFSVAEMRDDIERVRAALGFERIGLLGHSWGGFLSGAYAAAWPGRVARLALVCPIGARGDWRAEFDATVKERLSDADRQGIRDLTLAARDTRDEAEYQRLKFEIANTQVQAYYSPSKTDFRPGLAGLAIRVREEALVSLRDWYGDPSWEGGLARLDCPSSVIYGVDDPVPGHVAQTWGRLLPRARVVGLDDCGHFPWFEDPEAFWEAFDYVFEDGA